MKRFGIEFVPMDIYWRTVYYCIQAEKMGYDHVWITDHFNNRNVYITLGLIANYTERIKLGPGVTNPYLVHPVMTAQAVAHLNEVAPGRVVCGLGAGDKTTLEMVGVEMRDPLRAVREAVELIRRQVARAKEGYEGKIFRASSGARLNFKVKDTIPVYIGAQGPKMLKLAGSIGDGVLINASHPNDVAEAVKHIESGVKEAGRKMEDVDITVYTSFSTSKDEASARNAVTQVVAYIVAGSPPQILERHGISKEAADRIREALSSRKWAEAFGAVTPDMISAFSISGTPDQCVEKINVLFKMGITQFVTGSPLGPNIRASISLFGRDILPHFKG